MYIDTKTLQQPMDVVCGSGSKETTEHIPSGFCIHTKFAHDKSQNSTKTYRGKDSMESVPEHIEEEAIRLANIPQIDMVPLTPGKKRRHHSATECKICGKEFLPGSNSQGSLSLYQEA